jgi:uncharacterized protein YbaP (TraB family)
MSEVTRRLVALIAACAALLAAAPASAKPPVWVLHGKGATVTLFGSVHILPRDTDWRPAALTQALERADELWFEIPLDPNSIQDAAREALARGMLPETESLPALLSENGRARLARAETDFHLPGPQLERLKPWLAELTISNAAYAKEGASADQGVERSLADAAPQAARHAFETPLQQVLMFAGAPPPVQVASLEDTLRDLQDDPDQSSRLIDAWLKGDLAAIDREGVQQLKDESPALFKILLTDRNAAWVTVLLRKLNAPPPPGGKAPNIVVVVGVGHLIGAGGLPQMLRARGVRVDGPKP